MKLKIRLSIGSAAVLGLSQITMDADPTTCYMMTFSNQPCQGRCSFCPQGYSDRDTSVDKLSRIQWPAYTWNEVIKALAINQSQGNSKKFLRICLQVINYPGFFQDIKQFLPILHQEFPKIPISVAIPPLNRVELEELHNWGVERVGIALDAATPRLFKEIKGLAVHDPYTWQDHWDSLATALEIFGKGYVTTHFIVGLGETEEEIIGVIHLSVKNRILPGLFMFMPVKGTPLANRSRPSLITFRHIQISRWMLLQNHAVMDRFVFDKGNLIRITKLTEAELHKNVDNSAAFKTAGCPNCNRPYYTSRPGEEPDGFPRELTQQEKDKIYSDLIPLLDPEEA